ncbi:MAG TPA: carbonic anhydrase [Thermoanaerobaculia bacterium]|nr:carbonic anhydrase [Thermoanaerobaculia bacterium]
MKYLPHLFDNNRRWAAGHLAEDPHFFERLCEIQTPEYLWIGCADSRVPANDIVGLAPGELFVHRNVANLVRIDDPNCMAVVQYAVEVLKVKHIIVTGHYGCGGVRAALENTGSGIVAQWLEPVVALRDRKAEELRNAADPWVRLCELNVIEQVEQLLQSDVLVRARGTDLDVHGWIYDLRDGLLRDLAVTTKLR